ncbi:vancomycin resistance protein YoaR [Aequitasia blattaphilus]
MGKISQQKKRMERRKRMRRKRQIALFGLICVIAIIIFGIITISTYKYVKNHTDDKICNNIYVDDINISGKTKKEAKKIVNEHLEEVKAANVTVLVGEQEVVLPLSALGIQYKELDKTLEDAVNYGTKGNIYSRYFQLKKLEKEKKTFPILFTLDEGAGKEQIQSMVYPLSNFAKNATLIVEGDTIKVEKEVDGTKVDVDKTFQKMIQKLNNAWDHNDFRMKAKIVEDVPSVKEEDLKDIKDSLGSFSTDVGYGDNRVNNIRVGVQRTLGFLLPPGEEYSFLEKAMPFTEESGYLPAGTYEGGEVVDSLGGGICQVSTTLYNALLYAELEMVERYPHSMTVPYVKPSRDAAIAEDALDLVFKNNYDYPIYVYGEITPENQLSIVVYGKETRDPGRRVEYESEVVSTEDYQTTYVEDYQSPIGSTMASGNASTGIEARLWKIVYENEVEVSRDVANNSHYQRSDRVVKVGTASENPNASSLVRSAISSQDSTAIANAISQAASMETGTGE